MQMIPTTHTSVISEGIRKFVRSLGIEMTTQQLVSTANELDLIDALESVKTCVKQSATMQDVKHDMEEFLIRGQTPRDTALAQRRNLAMYLLVISPTIEMLSQLEFNVAAHHVDSIVNSVIDMINATDDYGDETDAIVACNQIHQQVAAYKQLNQPVKKKQSRGVTRYTFIDDQSEYESDSKEEESYEALMFD